MSGRGKQPAVVLKGKGKALACRGWCAGSHPLLAPGFPSGGEEGHGSETDRHRRLLLNFEAWFDAELEASQGLGPCEVKAD